jgi:hypothetical protein
MTPPTDVRSVLKRQYHAALAMLEEAIRSCPDDEWTSADHRNAFWQVAYHTLFFTHLYLQPNDRAFRPWKGHRSEAQYADGIAGPPDPKSSLPLLPEPYPKEQVIDYVRFCDQMVDRAIDGFDLESPESGFHWYPVSKLEHQLINIRHVQHHAAQLADRLRSAADVGVRWVGSRSA